MRSRWCTARTRGGRPCSMPPLDGKDVCFAHCTEPAWERARRAARRRGGESSIARLREIVGQRARAAVGLPPDATEDELEAALTRQREEDARLWSEPWPEADRVAREITNALIGEWSAQDFAACFDGTAPGGFADRSAQKNGARNR